ncbi:MAG: carnitine dehydratase [Proteobacteria bacterium SG_bin9]|nr:MAG: carnitine dehydratase [Proteobacteria bacterium SG_bin9]
MQSPRDILSDLWTGAGGTAADLAAVTLTGSEPVLPSSFRVDAAAQASIAAAGLAAATIWKARSGQEQSVGVDMLHAAIECRSERYLRVDDKPPPPAWDAIAGVYRTGDARFVRLHTNFPLHRDNVCKVLKCEATRDSVQDALMGWRGEDFETAAYDGGCVVSLMRTRDEWLATEHAKALITTPLITFEKIGDAPPRPWPQGDRPLAGLRVLDLSRVIAGPVAGRTLAAHGADVMLVSHPALPSIPWLVIDTGRGKLSSFVDLSSAEGKATFTSLLSTADVFSQGYRPQSLAAHGFGPEDAARINPGIVCVSLSAYGHAGPWANRRGFDSLVQTSTGFNHAEGEAAGVEGPKELPMQVLDHATGYLMAFGAMMGRLRQAKEGGSWLVRVSLARTGHWLWGLGRVDGGLSTPEPEKDAVAPFMGEEASGFGTLRAVRHSARLTVTPAAWTRPAVPLGNHPAVWPT